MSERRERTVVAASPADLIGRRAELDELGRVLGRLADGRGGLALIVGEPGIGKTALAEAAVVGVPALWARAREQPGAPPLWLWDQVMRVGRSSGRTDWGASPGPATAIGTGHDRFRRFDDMAAALVDMARRRPFAVVLDDLQWADAESAAFLDFLTPELATAPLVIVTTARRGELAVLPRSDVVVELSGLGGEELRALVSRHVGGDVGDELLAVVDHSTAGSPFFVGEVARLLRASGRAADAASWRGVVPEGVRAVLQRRMARLPQASHDAIAAASVVGMEFDATVLAALLEVDRADAFDRLAPAVHAGLLRDLGDGRFVFAHALVRDAVAAEIGPARRRALHERAATIVEVTVGSRAAPEIAGHWRAAGDGERAATWAAEAGEVAYRVAMYAEAAEWFERAVDAGAGGPGLRVRLADALSRSGHIAEANAGYVVAAREARAQGDVESLARAALGVGTVGGGFEVRLLDPAQLALLEEALALLGDVDSPVRAVLLARLAVATTMHAVHTERAALADEAVGIARRVGDPGALAYALSAWCDVHAGPADRPARVATAGEMLTAAQRSGDPELELLARRFLIVGHMEAGDVVLAAREVDAFVRLAGALRQPQFLWYARLVEGMLALLRGDLDRAERLGHEASDLGRLVGSANAKMLADGALLPMVARERSDAGYMVSIDANNRDQPESARGLEAVALYGVGYGGSKDAVRRSLAQFGGGMAPDDGLYVLVLALRGDGAAFVGDDEVMDATYHALLPFADRMVLDGTAAVYHGPVSSTLGRIAAARGDRDEARRWYDAAIVALQRVGAPLLLRRVEDERAALDGDAAAASVPAGEPNGAAMVREGDVWLARFDGATVRLRHSKGLSDLAVLLGRPGRDVHVLDLVAVGEERSAGSGVVSGDVGETLDAAARSAYEARIRELTEDLDEATAANDFERAARLDDERAVLLDELARALGLSGRPRRPGGDVERARKAVGMRLRGAIDRIDHDLPALGRHLRHSVQTGTFCSYRPEHPVPWRIQP